MENQIVSEEPKEPIGESALVVQEEATISNDSSSENEQAALSEKEEIDFSTKKAVEVTEMEIDRSGKEDDVTEAEEIKSTEKEEINDYNEDEESKCVEKEEMETTE